DLLNLREEPLLLLLGTELDQRRCEQAFTEERDAVRRVRPRVLLVEDDLLGDVRGAPAVLLRPGQADPTVAAEQLLPLDADVPPRLVARTVPRPERGELAAQVLPQPGAHLRPESRFRGRVDEIHGGPTLLDRPVGFLACAPAAVRWSPDPTHPSTFVPTNRRDPAATSAMRGAGSLGRMANARPAHYET